MKKPEELRTDTVATDEDNEYTVEYWRKRFGELKPSLKRNWHSQLAEFDASLDTLKGANNMRAVSHNKASLVVTQHIVSLIEQMLAKSKKGKRREKSLIERLNMYPR